MSRQVIPCRNCDFEYEGNYCPNCGIKRVEIPFQPKSAFPWMSEIFEFDKGYLYTIKQLIVRPDFITQEYLRGKVGNYSNPIKTLLLTIALLVIFDEIVLFIDSLVHDAPPENDLDVSELGTQVGYYGSALIYGMSIFFVNKITFSKRFNVTEHLVIIFFEMVALVLIMISSQLLIILSDIFIGDDLSDSVYELLPVGFLFCFMLYYYSWFNRSLFFSKLLPAVFYTLFCIVISFILLGGFILIVVDLFGSGFGN